MLFEQGATSNDRDQRNTEVERKLENMYSATGFSHPNIAFMMYMKWKFDYLKVYKVRIGTLPLRWTYKICCSGFANGNCTKSQEDG